MAAAWDKVGKLKEVLRDLRLYRVLDPACGSGNFLYVAYRELKRLEREILLRLSEISKGEPLETAVSIHQFHGLDIQPFAVELAKVTLMLAKEQEVKEAAKLMDSDGLLVLEKPLPLDNLDKNILCADALFTDWPKADAIVGNPPYLGAKLLKPEYGPDYVKRIRQKYAAVPGMADFCVYWFRRAHDELAKGGRAGLVGTQNIRSNASRIGSLDYIVSSGTITEAVSAQVWSGEAAVHVSIVNWIKGEEKGLKTLSIQKGDKVDSPWESFELETINASLSNEFDVTGAVRLQANIDPQVCFSGQVAGHKGFMLSPEEAKEMIAAEPASRDVIHPCLIGRDMLRGDGTPSEFVIDFQTRDVFESGRYSLPFSRIKALVLPARELKAGQGIGADGEQRSHYKQFLKYWWRHSFDRPELIELLGSMPRYIVCSDTTKRPVFEFISKTIRPDHKLRVFAFCDDYSFGILQSQMHWQWFIAKCSKLKGDFNYTSSTVFDTFPWPQSPTRPQIEAVAKEAVALRQLRREVMAKMDWSLRDLYRTLEEPGSNPLRDAQAKLDAAVRAAYGMPKTADILAFLLDLNQTCACRRRNMRLSSRRTASALRSRDIPVATRPRVAWRQECRGSICRSRDISVATRRGFVAIEMSQLHELPRSISGDPEARAGAAALATRRCHAVRHLPVGRLAADCQAPSLA
jgi:hypothetical protein